MNIYLNPRSAILFTIFIQALVTAALLFKRAHLKKKLSDSLLATLLLSLAFSLTDFILGFLGIYDRYAKLIFFPFENLFLITALIYLYSLSLLQKDKVTLKIIVIHLILPAIYFVSHFVVFSLNDFKQPFLQQFYFPFLIYIERVGYYVISSYYFARIIKLFNLHRSISNDNYTQINAETINWFRYFIWSFIAYLVLDFMLSATDAFFKLSFEQQYWKYLLRAFLTSFLCIAGYSFNEDVSITTIEFETHKQKRQQEKNLLSPIELDYCKQKVLECFKNDKPYLEPELDLNRLSQKLGMSANIISYTINKGCDKNFNDFVNQYRVDEVKEKFKDPANRKLTLLAIALDCGFNSKTTFNRAFKKLTSESPGDYWQRLNTN